MVPFWEIMGFHKMSDFAKNKSNYRLCFFWEGFRSFWIPSEHSTTISRSVEYSIDAFLGDPQIKNREKNRFLPGRGLRVREYTLDAKVADVKPSRIILRLDLRIDLRLNCA